MLNNDTLSEMTRLRQSHDSVKLTIENRRLVKESYKKKVEKTELKSRKSVQTQMFLSNIEFQTTTHTSCMQFAFEIYSHST